MSIFHQAGEIINLPDVNSVIEFGSGRGLTKAIVSHYGVKYTTVDINGKNFLPDFISTISEFSTDETYDLVCAFQCLEHNPLENVPGILRKMAKHSRRYVYISVPFNGIFLSITATWRLPKFASNLRYYFAIPKGILARRRPVEQFKLRPNPYSAHWWEVGDQNLGKKQFESILNSCGLNVKTRFHNQAFPYHLFYMLEKQRDN